MPVSNGGFTGLRRPVGKSNITLWSSGYLRSDSPQVIGLCGEVEVDKFFLEGDFIDFFVEDLEELFSSFWMFTN